jgi:hypothetical protein
MDLVSRLASYGFIGILVAICAGLLAVGLFGVTMRRRRTT